MQWLHNFNQSIEYIENNLDKEISYDEAARIACCSTNYFQRLFSYVTDIPLSEYIRRRKMTQAAFDLQNTDKKVLDIALKYGYSSPTAFNRAFQSVHGIAPTAARNAGAKLNTYMKLTFQVKVTGEQAMPYHIEEKEAMRIVGIRTPMFPDDLEANLEIGTDFWKETRENNPELYQSICHLADDNFQNIFSLTIYDEEKLYYYIGVPSTKPAPPGMYVYEVPASTWVVFENKGNIKENVWNVHRRFWTEWLPFS